ncbi:hypothetical protein ACFLSG_01960, partial [Candidatus Bipolaricaulota bacterium]
VEGGGPYVPGATALLTATPADGLALDHWEGDLSGSENPASVQMDVDKAITAVFVEAATLSASAEPLGTGVVSGIGDYAPGATAQLTATPSPNWGFVGWGGDINSKENPVSVVVREDMAVTANFAQYQLQTDWHPHTEGDGSPANPGTVTGGGVYSAGETVLLTAIPNDGWWFERWDGDSNIKVNPLPVVMDGDKTIHARFYGYHQYYPFQLSADVYPGGVNAGSVVGVGSFRLDTKATLEAVPSEGWYFHHWSKEASDWGNQNPIYPFVVDGNIRVGAVFARYEADYYESLEYELNLEAVPAVGGSVYDRGRHKAVNAQNWFDEATEWVDDGWWSEVEAVPAPGWVFDHWEDSTGSFESDESRISVPLPRNQDKMFIAVFKRLFTLSTSPMPTEGGSIEGEGAYIEGASATLTATPSPGFVFDRWEGDASSRDNPITVSMSSDKAIKAVFTTCSLRFVVSGHGTVEGAGDFVSGTTTELRAIPDDDWGFVGWSGDIDSNDNPISVVVDEDITVTANFAQYQLQTDWHPHTEGDGSPANPGTVTGGGVYGAGETVLLTAIPNDGWWFERWDGDSNIKVNPLPVVMDGDKTIHARFYGYHQYYPFQLSADVYPGGVNAGSVVGVGSFRLDTKATLEAVPSEGWYFHHWSKEASDWGNQNPIYPFVVDGNIRVGAVFARYEADYYESLEYELNLEAVPAVGGSVYDRGQRRAANAQNWFDEATEWVDDGWWSEVEAVPVPGWTFDHWEDGDGSSMGTENPILIQMDGDKTIIAVFDFCVLTTSWDPEDGRGGTIAGGGMHAAGGTVQLEALPEPGWFFDHWEGDAVGYVNPVTIEMDSDKAVTAVFVEAEFSSMSYSGVFAVSGANMWPEGLPSVNINWMPSLPLNSPWVSALPVSKMYFAVGSAAVKAAARAAGIQVEFDVGASASIRTRGQASANGLLTYGGPGTVDISYPVQIAMEYIRAGAQLILLGTVSSTGTATMQASSNTPTFSLQAFLDIAVDLRATLTLGTSHPFSESFPDSGEFSIGGTVISIGQDASYERSGTASCNASRDPKKAYSGSLTLPYAAPSAAGVEADGSITASTAQPLCTLAVDFDRYLTESKGWKPWSCSKPGAFGSLGGYEYTLLDLIGDFVAIAHQELAFDPNFHIRYEFSQAVTVDGEQRRVVEVASGEELSVLLPTSSTGEIVPTTVIPTVMMSNEFTPSYSVSGSFGVHGTGGEATVTLSSSEVGEPWDWTDEIWDDCGYKQWVKLEKPYCCGSAFGVCYRVCWWFEKCFRTLLKKVVLGSLEAAKTESLNVRVGPALKVDIPIHSMGVMSAPTNPFELEGFNNIVLGSITVGP